MASQIYNLLVQNASKLCLKDERLAIDLKDPSRLFHKNAPLLVKKVSNTGTQARLWKS